MLTIANASYCLANADAPVRASEMRVVADLICTVAADDSLAHDAFSMTTDSEGRPVVSGPGYIRTLIDKEGDGRYDSAVTWVSVQQGAQGMWREGNILYYVADGALWRSIDSNNDLRGDGRPESLLKLLTGGEHDAHAIRRGPDGYWYLTTGNFSNAQVQPLLNDAASPVLEPKAGMILRISPDFKTRSVWAHGLRNTYDFDFLPNGELVTYDSDEERESSLPAYKPTRVLVMSPGSDAGWVSPAWTDDDVRLTMPLNLASLGRGSPTGVCVYQHDALGDRFRNAVIALDWTFGRVIAIFPETTASPADASNRTVRTNGQCKWEVILEPSGTAGFAPTDVCVTKEGDLLVVTGGRGTNGTIYRLSKRSSLDTATSTIRNSDEHLITQAVSTNTGDSNRQTAVADEQNSDNRLVTIASSIQFTSTSDAASPESISTETANKLRTVLTQPCPWEAWSLAQWLPNIDAETVPSLMDVLSGELEITGLPPESPITSSDLRMRAAQLLVYTRTIVPAAKLIPASQDENDTTRAAAWYALGRGQIDGTQQEIEAIYQASISQSAAKLTAVSSNWATALGCYAQRARWEALGLRQWICTPTQEIVELDVQAERSLKQLEVWAYARQTNASSKNPPEFSRDLARAVYEKSQSDYRQGLKIDAEAFDRLAQSIRNGKHKSDPVEILAALCFAQTSLSDSRQSIPSDRNPENASILDGYMSQRFKLIDPALRAGWSAYCLNVAEFSRQSGWPTIEAEAIRTVASFHPDASNILDRLLAQIDLETHPTADVNVLCVIAACGFKPTPNQSLKIAQAYAGVHEKIAARDLPTDTRWSTRQQQLLEALSGSDSRFVPSLISNLSTTASVSLDWVSWLPLAQQREAATAVTKQMLASEPQQWTTSQVKIAGRFSIAPELANQIRMIAMNAIESPVQDKTDQTNSRQRFDSDTAIVLEILAKTPTTADYNVLLNATASSERLLRQFGWSGLRKLPIGNAESEFNVIALLAAANHSSPIEGVDLNQLAGRLRNVAAQLKISNVPSARDPWTTWAAFFNNSLKGEAVLAQWEELNRPPAAWIDLVKASQSRSGDSNRGAALFQRGQCVQCHNSAQAVGPSLTGSTRRFSYEDLFRAIYEPDRDISDRFRATKVLTTNGDVIVGMIEEESEELLKLKLADGTTREIKAEDIDEKAESETSLMPANLLQGWTSDQLSDLYAHLKELK